jgi:hypothetical protein
MLGNLGKMHELLAGAGGVGVEEMRAFKVVENTMKAILSPKFVQENLSNYFGKGSKAKKAEKIQSSSKLFEALNESAKTGNFVR